MLSAGHGSCVELQAKSAAENEQRLCEQLAELQAALARQQSESSKKIEGVCFNMCVNMSVFQTCFQTITSTRGMNAMR